jgi:hypothetical protein
VLPPKSANSHESKRGNLHHVLTEYILLGKRKQEWRSKFEDAKTAALERVASFPEVSNFSLPLVNGDRLEYRP